MTSSARPAQARVQSKGGVRSRKPDEHLAALAQTDRPFAQGQDSSKLTSEDQAECVLSTGKRLHERLFRWNPLPGYRRLKMERLLGLSTLGMFELGLDPGDVLPPLKSDRPDTGPVVR